MPVSAAMVDYHELISLLSIPRPNGSAAEAATGRALRAWLEARGIPCQAHAFRLYPYFFEAIGLWLILSRTLLAASIWLRWGWPALAIALIGLAGGALDWTKGIPLVTWPGAQRGENLVVEIEPDQGERAIQEVVISAHYDSKTELLDHRGRAFFVRLLPPGMALTLLVGVLGLLDGLLAASAPQWSNAAFVAGAALSLVLLVLAWGLGLNLALGRLAQPSTGAVDNGAACAVVAGLAERLAREGGLRRTVVTLALFTGDEANMQGSRAYVASRSWPFPVAVVNLELLGQNGGYVLWEQDGTGFRALPTSPEVNQRLAAVVQAVIGKLPQRAGLLNSDGASFLARGIPTAVLGTRDQVWDLAGLHRPSDSLDRVDLARLPEAVDILARFIRQIDEENLALSCAKWFDSALLDRYNAPYYA